MARVVEFMVSDAARWVNGQAMRVNAGMAILVMCPLSHFLTLY